MKWLVYNGTFPTQIIWQNFFLVLAFELIVIAVEALVITYIHGKYPKFPLYFTIIIANVITFMIGAVIQGLGLVMWS